MKTTNITPARVSLSSQLDQLREAESRHRTALGHDAELKNLDAALRQRKPELRSLAGEPPDPRELARLICETPEQCRIEAIREERRQAEVDIARLWREIQPGLDRMRSGRTRELFETLDALDRQDAHIQAKRRIELVQAILLSSGHRASGKPRQKPVGKPDMAAVKVLIKQLHREGLSHQGICTRLDQLSNPCPPSAAWADLRWTKAFQNKNTRDAVKTYISKAIRS